MLNSPSENAQEKMKKVAQEPKGLESLLERGPEGSAEGERIQEGPSEISEVASSVISEAAELAQEIAPTQSIVYAAVPKDPLVAEVEAILEEDLTDAFLQLDPQAKQVFIQKGEEVAVEIGGLLGNAKKFADKIFGLIRDWLGLLPGVNRFFLEQEAKIKTDKLVVLAQEEASRAQEKL